MATDSSLFIVGKWEWSEGSGSNRETRTQQCYKNVHPNTNQDNMALVINRHKMRGKGRALHLTFTSDTGKDAELVGWGIWIEKNTRP